MRTTPMPTFEKELVNDGHTTKFTVRQGGDGWEANVEEDSRVVRSVRYTDWHRVERAVSKMSWEASELERLGWREKAVR